MLVLVSSLAGLVCCWSNLVLVRDVCRPVQSRRGGVVITPLTLRQTYITAHVPERARRLCDLSPRTLPVVVAIVVVVRPPAISLSNPLQSPPRPPTSSAVVSPAARIISSGLLRPNDHSLPCCALHHPQLLPTPSAKSKQRPPPTPRGPPSSSNSTQAQSSTTCACSCVRFFRYEQRCCHCGLRQPT